MVANGEPVPVNRRSDDDRELETRALALKWKRLDDRWLDESADNSVDPGAGFRDHLHNPMTIQAGSRLGPYEILTRVGAGGMGEVFRARDTRLDRTVAVKILPSAHASNAQLRLRFEREAKAISALNHPHICSLYDVGRESEIDYLVMEFIEGETLADRLVHGPLPIDDAIRYGIEISDALDRAHRQGIVHRDLKPGNIMLTRGGVKLLDFGLARTASATVVNDGTTMATEARPLTSEGTIVGTFQYMAPEQLEGIDADARTDIFALGALLYEMATGHRAFDGKTRTSVIAAIVAGTPRPIAELQPLTPRAFEFVVQRCLEKDREARWQSAHDIKLELLRIAQQSAETAVAPRRTSRAGWIAAAVAAAVAVGAIGFAWHGMRQTKAPQVRGFLLPPPGVGLATNQILSLSISPDERMITFRGNAGDARLWVRSVGADDAHPMPGTEGGEFPFWSPDGKWIAFFADEKLKKVSLAGTPPITICNVGRGRSGAWLENGTILFSPQSESPIFSVSAAGGAPAAVTKVDPSLHETTHRWATMLPDGKHFLYLAASHDLPKKTDQNAIWFSSIDKPSERKLVVRSRYNAAYGGGRLFYAKQDVLVAQPFDPNHGDLSGEPERVVGGLETQDGYFKAAFDVSRNGTVVYHVLSSDVRLMRQEGGVSFAIGPKGDIAGLDLSRDGKRVAATVYDEATANGNIWIYDVDSGDANRFTATSDENNFSPVWMPDGKSLIYSSGTSSSKMYLASADGSQRRELSNVPTEAFSSPRTISPDGAILICETQHTKQSNQRDLWYAPIAGGAPKPFLNSSNDECCPSLSPDGKWITYWSSSKPGTGAISVARFPSGTGTVVVPCDGLWGGTWTTNGIVCVNPSSTLLVQVTTSDAAVHFGKPTDLGIPTKNISGMVTIDAKRFVYTTHEETREEQAIGIITPER